VASVKTLAAYAATVPLAASLAGCVTTQQIAARTRLVNARILASQTVPPVVRANPEVGVGSPVLIGSRAGTAIVVPLRNQSATVLTDLPISVGIRTRAGRNLYLNHSANLDYFQTHVPVLGPRAATVWVFTTGRRVARGRPFATVGFSQLPAATDRALPRIEVSPRRGRADGTVIASVTNRSAIPQYDLQVYAVAVRGGRDVAAGQAAVAHLGTRGRSRVSIALLGAGGAASLWLIALPTIFS
jgi:hypothetical protein